MDGLDKPSEAARSAVTKSLTAVVAFERKLVYFDIPAYWHNPDACGRALENMKYQLKEKYQGRYIFSHEEKLPPFDSKGQSIITRRYYYVDTQVSDMQPSDREANTRQAEAPK